MKKALRQLVSTDRRFQSSVNLMLDIDSDDKVESYIPTRSSLSILASYLNDIKSSNHGNATVLIGPYGKGKSHLILVWLAFLAGTKTKTKEKLIKKIEAVDPDPAFAFCIASTSSKNFFESMRTNSGSAFPSTVPAFVAPNSERLA